MRSIAINLHMSPGPMERFDMFMLHPNSIGEAMMTIFRLKTSDVMCLVIMNDVYAPFWKRLRPGNWTRLFVGSHGDVVFFAI